MEALYDPQTETQNAIISPKSTMMWTLGLAQFWEESGSEIPHQATQNKDFYDSIGSQPFSTIPRNHSVRIMRTETPSCQTPLQQFAQSIFLRSDFPNFGRSSTKWSSGGPKKSKFAKSVLGCVISWLELTLYRLAFCVDSRSKAHNIVGSNLRLLAFFAGLIILSIPWSTWLKTDLTVGISNIW